MSHADIAYFQSRAEQEIELAQRAENSRAVQAHYELASAYLDRIHGGTSESGTDILSN
jgi:hypothetical protein